MFIIVSSRLLFRCKMTAPFLSCVFLTWQFGIINRVRINGTDRKQFARGTVVGSPNALAIDWMSRNLYFTNVDAK